MRLLYSSCRFMLVVFSIQVLSKALEFNNVREMSIQLDAVDNWRILKIKFNSLLFIYLFI